MIVQGCRKKILMEIRCKIVESAKKRRKMKRWRITCPVMRRKNQIFLKFSFTFSKKLLRLA